MTGPQYPCCRRGRQAGLCSGAGLWYTQAGSEVDAALAHIHIWLRNRGGSPMKRWVLVTAALAIAALTAAPPAARAQAKDTLVVALVSHAPTLDPHMHFERVGILVNINMFDSLLHKNARLEYEPSLATSWKALSDTQWEFKLRKGVKFHNGETMTPDDVKYSFERVLDQKKKSPQYGNVRAIKEIRIVDPETIHIITDKPFPLLLERLLLFSPAPRQPPPAVARHPP